MSRSRVRRRILSRSKENLRSGMNLSYCCCSLLLLLLLLNSAGGKLASDLQTLKNLLEKEADSDPQSGLGEARTGRLAFVGPEEMTWKSAELSSSALERLFKDLLRTTRRSWSRYKKGGMRSCFGVRLDRIGSFSGLGC